jgi:hypothetical protein
MKLKIRSLLTFALATGLLFSTSHIRRVNADDQHDKTCSNKSLNGPYGFYRTGNTSSGPLAALGILSFDGNGGSSGSQSISRNGVFTVDIPISGPYEINADCTGKLFLPNGTEAGRIVIVDGGKGFYIFSEAVGNAVYGVGRKIDAPEDN